MNEYYSNLFNNKGGGFFKIRQGSIGYNIFDPLLIKGEENDLRHLYLHADKFNFFRIRSDYFIEKMKEEIKFAVQSKNKPFHWDVLGKTTQSDKME